MAKHDWQPDEKYTHWSQLINDMDRFSNQFKRGELSEKQWNGMKLHWGVLNERYASPEAPEGVLSQTNNSMLNEKRTTHSDRPLIERQTESWSRSHQEPIWEGSRNEHHPVPPPKDAVLPPTREIALACFYVFVGDELLPNLPLSLNHRGLDEAANRNNLSFAVTMHSTHLAQRAHAVGASDAPPRWDLWILRELKTGVAREERSYGSGDFWQESTDGQPMKLIMSVVQKTVLRCNIDPKL